MPARNKARDAAIAQGLKRYFTGEPCKRGHVAERLVSNNGCLACAEESEKANRHKSRARLNRWREENCEYVRERDREYRAENVEAAREREHRWREKHGDDARTIKAVIQQNFYARELGAKGSHTVEDIVQILTAQKHKCFYCNKDLSVAGKSHGDGSSRTELEIDHVVPMKQGGTNDKNNLVVSCAECNKKKSNRAPLEFVREIGLSEAKITLLKNMIRKQKGAT